MQNKLAVRFISISLQIRRCIKLLRKLVIIIHLTIVSHLFIHRHGITNLAHGERIKIVFETLQMQMKYVRE